MTNVLVNLVDIDCMKEEIQDGSKIFISRWKDTAIEICPTEVVEISNLFTIYDEFSEKELNSDRAIMFINALLNLLDEEDQRKLITVQCPGCLKNA